jgi:signal transduction histidine kinase
MTIFSLVSRLGFTIIFIIFLPLIIERINIIQTDMELIRKREKVIKLIEEKGLEQFMFSDSVSTFGSYNILKNEFINIEKTDIKNTWNFIEVTNRIIEGETIEFRILNYSFRVHDTNYLLEIGKSTESIKATEETTKRVILVFLISFIVITLASDLLYTRHLLYPLRLIIKKLKSASSPELFDREPIGTTTADFVRLDQTLRALMDKISDSFRREKDITVNISHELLTPISIIRSKLENLLLTENPDENVQVKIEESLTTLSRLTTLVNSLLFIARTESSQYLKEDSFAISDLLNEICDEILPVAENKKIQIKRDFSADFIIEGVNRSLLFSMFFNIVNNSVKNTSPGGEIFIKSYTDNNIYKVFISDNGRGMTKEQMETLFSRFHNRQKDNKEGTGIGLAIAKSIADYHNIKIDVTSEPGKGTEFYFSFLKNS